MRQPELDLEPEDYPGTTLLSRKDLKPCPFCGSMGLYVIDAEGMEVSVFCETCHAMGPIFDRDCRDDVVEAWNKRVRGNMG